MLNSYNHHLWAPTGLGSSFVAPEYYTNNFGGSNAYYPRSVVPEDMRGYLPFWGGSPDGGCCHVTQLGTDGANWGRAYSLDLALTSGASAVGDTGTSVLLPSGVASLGAVSVGVGSVLEVGAAASSCEFSAGGSLTLAGVLSTSANCVLSVAATGNGSWLQTGGAGLFRQGASLNGPVTVSGSGSVLATAAGANVTFGGVVTVGAGASFNVGASGELSTGKVVDALARARVSLRSLDVVARGPHRRFWCDGPVVERHERAGRQQLHSPVRRVGICGKQRDCAHHDGCCRGLLQASGRLRSVRYAPTHVRPVSGIAHF